MKNKNNSFSIDTLFILLLLCLFTIGALIITSHSIKAYENIYNKSNESFDKYTPLSYVSTKIRQYDNTGFIRIETVLINDKSIDALVLKAYDGDDLMETWIYNYNDNIYEQYIDVETTFIPEDGIAIFSNNNIYFSLEENFVKITNLDKMKIPTTLCLYLRSKYATGNFIDGGIN